MMNNQKNTSAINIGFIATKVIITAIAAFINPWLVVPVLVTMELTTIKLANKIRPGMDKKRDDSIPLPINSTKGQGKKPKENVQESQPQRNVNRKRNVRFSRTVPQLKSSRPKAKKGDQI